MGKENEIVAFRIKGQKDIIYHHGSRTGREQGAIVIKDLAERIATGQPLPNLSLINRAHAELMDKWGCGPLWTYLTRCPTMFFDNEFQAVEEKIEQPRRKSMP